MPTLPKVSKLVLVSSSFVPLRYAQGWKTLGPAARDYLGTQNVTRDPAFARTALVHFRCSDVPFSRHDEYFLLPKRYFESARAWLDARRGTWDNVVVLSCPELPAAGAPASPLAASKCPAFRETIVSWLGAAGATTLCLREPKDALSAMMGAAALVSTGGSFSFAAGIGRGDGAFFAPSLAGIGDFPEAAKLASVVPWASSGTHDRVGHGCVDDYASFDYARSAEGGCASADDSRWTPSPKYKCSFTDEAKALAATARGDRVVATGASKSHAWHLAEFAKQFHSLDSGLKLVAYDLGLGPTREAARSAVEQLGGELRDLPWAELPDWMKVEGGKRYAGERRGRVEARPSRKRRQMRFAGTRSSRGSSTRC